MAVFVRSGSRRSLHRRPGSNKLTGAVANRQRVAAPAPSTTDADIARLGNDGAPDRVAYASCVAPTHPDVIRSSAASYLSYLDALIAPGQLTQSADVAAHALRDSVEKLLDPTSHGRTGILFNANLLSPCTADERSSLVNQWALGIGNDGARVVFMGTEHAYDIDSSPVGLALESCGSPLLWLDDGGPELAASIAQDSAWVKSTGRNYHPHPSDHYAVRGGHTCAL